MLHGHMSIIQGVFPLRLAPRCALIDFHHDTLIGNKHETALQLFKLQYNHYARGQPRTWQARK